MGGVGERSCPFLMGELCSVLHNPCPFKGQDCYECPYRKLYDPLWDYSLDPLAF